MKLTNLLRRHPGALPLILLFCCVASVATAQTVTLTVSPTSANGTATPTLTWSNSFQATSCTASGGWSGTKAPSGTQTLPAVDRTTSYSLSCTRPATSGTGGTATVNWTAPTTNVNGTPLTNLAGFRVVYGTSQGNLSQSATVSNPAVRSWTSPPLANGTWYFGVHAVNSAGLESDLSNVLPKDVVASGGSPAVTASASASVTVNPIPSPPVLTSVDTVVFNIKRQHGKWYLSQHVANVPVGTEVVRRYTIAENSGMCQIARDVVKKKGQIFKPSKGVLVVRCA